MLKSIARIAKFGLPPLSCPNWNDYCVGGYDPTNGGGIGGGGNSGGGGSGGTGNGNTTGGNTHNQYVTSPAPNMNIFDPNANDHTSQTIIPTPTKNIADTFKQFAIDNPKVTIIFTGALFYLLFKK